ncbi:hypothetical protein [Dyadobacter psychrotolerans]|uniref:Uncharacterized protein n=1 Tax=Dyadobacter psychrotolerans TaxID=2541721 RepID=A0A4V2Z3Q9_9BACT|nr:hypothetical protein [Dyadobacter psychrotolerans]TDE13618.1 hypothetical protein E0F88_17065 [Dyadobacter psychrotolerans]
MKTYLTLIRIIFFFAAFALIVVGSLFFIQHWNGGRLMMGAGLVLMLGAFVQFPHSEKSSMTILRILLTTTALSTLLIGTLFFIQNWGSVALLGIGVLLSVLILFDKLVSKKVF